MSDVVDLSARKRADVWRCLCGSYAFWLYADGSAYCTDCEKESATMHGYWKWTAEPGRNDSRRRRHNTQAKFAH